MSQFNQNYPFDHHFQIERHLYKHVIEEDVMSHFWGQVFIFQSNTKGSENINCMCSGHVEKDVSVEDEF